MAKQDILNKLHFLCTLKNTFFNGRNKVLKKFPARTLSSNARFSSSCSCCVSRYK